MGANSYMKSVLLAFAGAGRGTGVEAGQQGITYRIMHRGEGRAGQMQKRLSGSYPSAGEWPSSRFTANSPLITKAQALKQSFSLSCIGALPDRNMVIESTRPF